MIVAAALLVLVALGLFVAGLVTAITVWYWACVAVSALAAVLLFITWRQTARANARTREPVAVKAAAPTADEKPAEPEPEPEPAAAAAPPEPEPAPAASADGADGGDPPAEDTEVSDLLLVVDMHDDVFVVDEHPRYHLADCRWLAGREAIPIPVDEARTDGFTPCGVCSPDRHLAQVARARKASTP